ANPQALSGVVSAPYKRSGSYGAPAMINTGMGMSSVPELTTIDKKRSKEMERERLAREVQAHLASEDLDWNEITAPGREVLMDIHKTTGLKHFPKLMSELREYSYLGAADEISRKGVSGGRNRWAYNKILEEGFAQHDKVYPMSETEKMLNPRRPRTDYLYKDDMIEVPEWLR
ncbi:MAG: hypothetical protein LBU87_03815, partial [Lactobacillales bacterium]|nr:hypothetical protein [Lactobacillales bacterium]